MASSQLIKQAAAAATGKPKQLSRFVDSIRLKAIGGRGGDGCISMLSVFGNEFAGPDGGNGGAGGHIVLKANKQVKSLGSVAKFYKGLPGVRGQGKNLYGANADHTIVEVPVGTIVTEAKPKELAEYEFDPDKSDIIAELDRDGSAFMAARGGAGGRGNASYLSNLNRHPRCAEAGAEGEERTYDLRMRLYAHVGLIGLPNAGKSSLLKSLTHAQVKIGDYSFTTLYPQVGVIEYHDDFTQLAISDLPGLIEDSHKNRGLGVSFLRHIQRCVCLLYLIDLSSANAVGQLKTLFKELELYKKGLSFRPHLVVGNKIDTELAECNLGALREFLAAERPGTRLMAISSLRGDNLEELKWELKRMYDEEEAKHADDPEESFTW